MVAVDEESGFLSICYPISYFEALLNKIVEKIFSESTNRKSSRKRDIKTLISGARMRVESIMAETELNAQEILNLKEDDVIVFNKNATSSTATIYINKKEKFSAISGISNNRKAIQIRANLDREKQETLDALRLMREEREQKAKESAENIRRLLNQKDSK